MTPSSPPQSSSPPEHAAEDALPAMTDPRELGVSEDALRAIQRGEVDALFIGGGGSGAIFARQGATEPYRLLIEEMQEGAATLNAQGVLLYANRALAGLLATPLESVMGQPVSSLVIPEHRAALAHLLEQMSDSPHGAGEFMLARADDTRRPVRITLSRLPGEGTARVGVVVVDLSLFKQAEEQLRIAARVFDKTGEAIVVTDPQAVI